MKLESLIICLPFQEIHLRTLRGLFAKREIKTIETRDFLGLGDNYDPRRYFTESVIYFDQFYFVLPNGFLEDLVPDLINTSKGKTDVKPMEMQSSNGCEKAIESIYAIRFIDSVKKRSLSGYQCEILNWNGRLFESDSLDLQQGPIKLSYIVSHVWDTSIINRDSLSADLFVVDERIEEMPIEG